MAAPQLKRIDVCLSPELIDLYPLNDRTVVVIDILRATSCMTTALANGVAEIVPVADLDACRAMRSDSCCTAGERNGEKLDGFDLGNSPFEYMNPDLKGKRIAFTTTNGTLAISKSLNAAEIIIGSFLNLDAVVRYLKAGTRDIIAVCAGWKGKVNLEDTLFAGALVHELAGIAEPECDAPLMALHLYRQAKDDLAGFLSNSSHVQRLKRLHIEKDIAFCLERGKYEVVPVVRAGVIVRA
ncbi:MAG TPA: 2-phosphosulfolactate phosphatase [Cyclobacteriaceae bacterium]|jgi:2-phosphosulfolactate phosphatase